MRRVLLTISALALVASCGGHTIDQEAWEHDLAEQGDTVVDWEGYRAVWEDFCGQEENFDLRVAVFLDEGTSPESIRTNIENACPDRLADLEDTLDSLRDNHAVTEEACSLPEEQRTEDQSLVAEAMGC